MSGWFRAAWKKKMIISGLLAIIVWGVIGYVCIQQIAMPILLSGAGGLTLLFFQKVRTENNIR